MTAAPIWTLDERGHPCPAPILALGRAAKARPGAAAALLADDPAADHDVPAWARMTGGGLLDRQPLPDGTGVRYLVRLPGAGKADGSATRSDSPAS